MTVACYVRVSTEDQSLDRQREKTTEYAQNNLGYELRGIKFYTDKSTGTNTSRDGYKELMEDAEEMLDLDDVVVSSVSRISRSIRDLDRTVERLKENGVAIHFIDEGLQIDPSSEDPFQNAMLRLLGVFAQLEAEMAQQRTREGLAAKMANDDYHHGPPPLGFTKDDGELYEKSDGNQRYEKVCTILEDVQAGETSKRQAAKELDTSRRTIGRSLERGELYGL